MQALVRKADEEVVNMLPRSVEIMIGDVGDPSTLKAAVEGCNKIIYCATARSSITGDLFRVDHQGVSNLTKALQVVSRIHFQQNRIPLSMSNIHYKIAGLQQQTSTTTSWKKQQKQALACKVQICRLIEWLGSSSRNLLPGCSCFQV